MQEATKISEDKTPWQEFIEELKEKGRSSIRFFSQRRAILKDPRVIANADAKVFPGWKSPLSFALHATLLVTLVVSFLGYGVQQVFDLKEPNFSELFTSDSSQQLKNYEGSIEQFKNLEPHSLVQIRYPDGSVKVYDRDEGIKILKEEATKLKRLIKLQSVNQSVSLRLQLIIANLILILSALFFKRSVVKDHGAIGQLLFADRYYLYLTTARFFWLNLILVGMVEVAKFGTTESTLPILGGLYILFFILSIYYFYKISADFYTALNIPMPKNLWGRQNRMFSKLVVSNLKSLVIVVTGFVVIDFACIWLISRLIL